MSDSQLPENEPPPIGTPIYDEPPTPDAEGDQPAEHVVVTPFTAGSAGGAHTESGHAGVTKEN